MLGLRCVFLLALVSGVALRRPKMSEQELSEFSDFMERTSSLQNALLDPSYHESDEDEESGHVNSNAWEISGKFEGDLVLNPRQQKLLVQDVAEGLSRNGIQDVSKRWPNNEVVYFIQESHFSSEQVQAIKDGMDDITRSSCITFRPHKDGDSDTVVIQGSRRGCFSQVGYQGGNQVLNLWARHPVGRGCFRHGTVVHEMLHTLGFFHMQSSHDRDDYIEVIWNNIVEGAKHNFRKYSSGIVSNFGVPYDYDSVLHYSGKAFSTNGGTTLRPKESFATIGQRRGMSDGDVRKLNLMYCESDSNSDAHDEAAPAQMPIKPFNGRGLGYYKGSSFVIDMPNLETYRVTDDTSKLEKYRVQDVVPKLETYRVPDYPYDSFWY